MTVAIADGILGLEAQCTWAPFAGGSYTINSRTGLPRAPLTRITGLHDLPDADDNREDNTGYPGETPYPGHPRGRTIVYEGVLKASGLQELRAHANQMRAAFRDRSNEGTMTHTPNVAWGAIPHFYKGRIIGFSSPEDQTQYRADAQPTPYQRPFSLTIRQSDPRYYVSPINVSPQQASGAVYVATNQGLIETPPIFHVAGALTDATITLQRDGGATLRFDDITLLAGQWMIIDFRTRYAYNEQTDEDLTGHINVGLSTWWDEGVEGLRSLVAENVSLTGAPWILDWYHANP